MSKIILTKSEINRVLRIIKKLKGNKKKRKSLSEQEDYLAIHLINRTPERSDLEILMKVNRNKIAAEELKNTTAYKNVKWFWTTEKFEILCSYRDEFHDLRQGIVKRNAEIRDDEDQVETSLPEDIVTILKWLKLCQ